MPTYVAFLRGVNVGGHNRMPMAELRALVEALGHEDVRTYIQSGNVVFEAASADTGTIAAELDDAIEEEFGYDVTVMVRTRDELDAVVDGQPFDDSTEESIKRYVAFLDGAPTEGQIEALQEATMDGERFVVVGREVYSELDKEELGGGRFTDVGKPLGTDATRRNWNVVQAVLELASA